MVLKKNLRLHKRECTSICMHVACVRKYLNISVDMFLTRCFFKLGEHVCEKEYLLTPPVYKGPDVARSDMFRFT